MIKKFLISSICICLFTSCGFKVVEIEKLSNYYISEVTSSGDSRINYKLKNKLMQNTIGNNKKPVIINLKTVKTKTIKEKNIKNEITKYNLNISITVDIKEENKSILKSFTLKENGSFAVKTKHSDSLNNEKKLIADLSNKLSNQIQNKITTILNNI